MTASAGRLKPCGNRGWDTRPSPGKRSCHGTAYGIIAAGII
nr:MAG TPA: hypothetical protein [Caudoviricetes sp.]DAN06138.1 MAG TPA: hypothetical protein [Caudoviricetes sp.]DAZ36462.1 MAG TPA: hypothetical protein [Caudoviricetes sp.]DAZ69333.1 MAG TPA: hypothetical protein [Caudoviricetes sp.]